jgi:hypothetical protein
MSKSTSTLIGWLESSSAMVAIVNSGRCHFTPLLHRAA